MIYVVYSNNHAMDAKCSRWGEPTHNMKGFLTATELPANVQIAQIRIHSATVFRSGSL